MPVALGSKGQADFTQPIELMMDCHRRIEHFLGVLCRVAERYGSRALDPEGREALRTSLDYFQQAAPRHTSDEEQSLFPRLRKVDAPAVRQALAELDHLEAEHRDAEVAHAQVEWIGRQWLMDGELSASQRAQLLATLEVLTQTYARHIEIEDRRIFALASQVLDAGTLAQVGMEMKLRRAASPGRQGSRCEERRKRLLTQQAQQRAAV